MVNLSKEEFITGFIWRVPVMHCTWGLQICIYIQCFFFLFFQKYTFWKEAFFFFTLDLASLKVSLVFSYSGRITGKEKNILKISVISILHSSGAVILYYSIISGCKNKEREWFVRTRNVFVRYKILYVFILVSSTFLQWLPYVRKPVQRETTWQWLSLLTQRTEPNSGPLGFTL